MSYHLPKVALVGRVNVGKSTLFNKILEGKKAIVSPVAGTTRDLNIGQASWQGRCFTLIDTGGLDIEQKSLIENLALAKTLQILKKSDLILLMVDGLSEPLPQDKAIAKSIKKNGQPVILVINKIDNPRVRSRVSPDFFKLGFGQPLFISALNGSGVGDLLDEIIKKVSSKQEKVVSKPDLKLSIIGKTNVGKSSILNAILGEDRVIVTPLPHTTREPQHTLINYQNKKILLVDTAGIRHKSKITDNLEKEGVKRTLETIKSSDVCLLITDVSLPLTRQDSAIASLVQENKNGLIIVANKWDLIKNKSDETFQKFIEYYQRHLPFLWWAPVVFVSAKEKQRMHKLLEIALEVQKERQKMIESSELDGFIRALVKKHKFGKAAGQSKPTILAFSQEGISPPRFLLRVKHKKAFPESYLKFIEKRLRVKFGFNGTPIEIKLIQPEGKKA